MALTKPERHPAEEVGNTSLAVGVDFGGPLWKTAKARVIAAPSQKGTDNAQSDNGELER